MVNTVCSLYFVGFIQRSYNGHDTDLSGLEASSKLLAGSLGAQDYIGGNGLADDLHLLAVILSGWPNGFNLSGVTLTPSSLISKRPLRSLSQGHGHPR